MIPLDPVIIAIWAGAALYLLIALGLTRMIILSHGGWGGLPRKGLLVSVALLMPFIVLIAWTVSMPAAIRQTRARFHLNRRRVKS